jgi:hypothetical protein
LLERLGMPPHVLDLLTNEEYVFGRRPHVPVRLGL